MSFQQECYYCVEAFNRTEQLLVNRIRDCNNGWTKINDSHREFRIGVQTNCNGEISKHIGNHKKTGEEIESFLKKHDINQYSLDTIDTEDEFSNRLTIENDSYNKLEKLILSTK